MKILTNGVFDIVHAGHIDLLKFCKDQGDYLIVALDTDRRVKEHKGNNRPINYQEDRKKVLQSIKYVDHVILFDSKIELINLYYSLKPDIIVKGDERTEEELRRLDEIPEFIDVKLAPFLLNKSSTNIMKKIRELESIDKI